MILKRAQVLQYDSKTQPAIFLKALSTRTIIRLILFNHAMNAEVHQLKSS